MEKQIDVLEKKMDSIILVVGTLVTSVEDMRKTMATKNDVENAKEEILDRLQPTEKAVDKDAMTIMNHGVRITRIEQHLTLK